MFAKFARGAVPDDVQDFKAAVVVLRPAMAIRSKRDFCDFIDGHGADYMHDRILDALPSLQGGKAAHFSADTQLLLERIRLTHDDKYYDAQERAVRRGCKAVSSHEWTDLKAGLRESLKEAAAHIALLHIAVQECEAPHVHVPHHKM
jgi:hypothetical protein